ncbi:MAG: sulfite exporter TauE/SafE family protein [Gammaproteobacteria bacterium]|nr:sulfite exporter TauE/SafE family protein [Gammaproteobacteria bacterium]
MTPLDPVTLSFGAALLLGLSFGSGPCNLACLPYLGPVLMSSSDGVRGSWRTILPFSLGRLTGYSLLGTVAGAVGLYVQDWIAEPWVRWLLGGATILVALSLFWRQRRGTTACKRSPSGKTVEVEIGREWDSSKTTLPGGLFFMGAGMALNPCAPLTMVILAAATTASALAGLSLGFGFGLGAVIIPTLIFALGVAHFGQQVREHLWQWRRTLENVSAGLLLLLGTGTALGWIAP